MVIKDMKCQPMRLKYERTNRKTAEEVEDERRKEKSDRKKNRKYEWLYNLRQKLSPQPPNPRGIDDIICVYTQHSIWEETVQLRIYAVLDSYESFQRANTLAADVKCTLATSGQ